MAVQLFELAAQQFDVCRHGNGFDSIGVVRMLDAKSPYFSAFAQHRFATHHDMFLDERFFAPLLHTGVNLQRFAIGGWPNKFGVDFQQGCANDASGFDQLAPRRYAALHKKVKR